MNRSITVTRGLSGIWYAVDKRTEFFDGRLIASTKYTISNADQLEQLSDSHEWLTAVLDHLQMTRDELADHLDVNVRLRAAA